MTTPTPSPGGLRFSLLGVPITIRISVVLILALLGLGAGDPLVVVMWVVIGIASIVVHELGHAVVARAGGADPHVELAGLGGVTRYTTTGRVGGRGWRLAISVAGPAVGIVVGVVALGLRAVVDPSGTVDAAFRILLFTSFGWSLFNLLPILPLDGGQALQSLLPGDEATRTVRTAWVGVVTSGLLVLAALWQGQLFLALFGGFFASQNVRTATSVRAASQDRAELQRLVDTGEWRALRDALADGRGDHATATAAQVGAQEAGELQLAAEIGEVVLGRGTDDPAFATRTAEAWAGLGLHDRATQARAKASELAGEQPPPQPPTG